MKNRRSPSPPESPIVAALAAFEELALRNRLSPGAYFLGAVAIVAIGAVTFPTSR